MHSWQTTLEHVARILNSAQVEWMFVGSAATAIRGAAIEPGDIDILMASPTAVHTAAAMLPSRPDRWPDEDPLTWHSSSTQPVLTWTHGGTTWTFGRWTITGTKVELAHLGTEGSSVHREDRLIEVGGKVWTVIDTLDWHGITIPIVPLELQIATMIVRDQQARLSATLTSIDARNLDSRLIHRSLADHGVAGSDPRVPLELRAIAQ